MTPKTDPDPAADDPNFVADYLLYLLAAASHGASAQFHGHVRASGLRVPEWRVLACLYDRDGAMITRLARFALIEQSSLTKIIIQMEERGLVRRQGDAEDRRRVRVWLTDSGRVLAAGLVRDARGHENSLLTMLGPGDGARLKAALRALIERLDPEALKIDD